MLELAMAAFCGDSHPTVGLKHFTSLVFLLFILSHYKSFVRSILIELNQYCIDNWRKIDATVLLIFNGRWWFLNALISPNPHVANQIRAEEICSSGIYSVFSGRDWDVHTGWVLSQHSSGRVLHLRSYSRIRFQYIWLRMYGAVRGTRLTGFQAV